MNNMKKFWMNIFGDVMGGIMTTVVALPVAMAFGIASNVGAAAGLYGAMACGTFAAIFGGTRGQQSGPTGPIAVVVAAIMIGSGNNPAIVFASTIVAGIFQLILGVCKIGRLIRYVPYPVLSGFMTGIALIIIILHIHPVFGTHSPHTITGVLSSLGKLYTEFNPAALLIALETFVLLYGLKFVAKNLPAPLIALIIATITSVCLNLDVPTIGAIPSQLPIPSLPSVEWSAMSAVLLGGLTIAILGAIDSLLTSLIADKLLHERHNSNKELIGQGVGNFVSGLIGGIPGAGSTTRTLANIYSGGRGPLAGLVYGGLVLLTITYLGTLASLIPLASLAAILIVLGINIIDWRSLGRLKALPLNDVIVMVVVLGLTLFADLVAAVGVGVALTCLLFVRKLSLRAASRQGILAQMSEAKQFFHSHSNDLLNKIYLYYFSGPLYFIEASKFSISLGELDDEPLQVVLIFQNNELLDQSFAFSLEDTISSMRKQEHYVWIVGLSEQNQNKLSELGCREALSAEFICGDLQEVVGRVNSLCSRRQSSDESVLLS